MEWRSWAGDPGSGWYTTLAGIDAGSFGDLEIAWRWKSPDLAWKAETMRAARAGDPPFPGAMEVWIWEFQATPLMVGGTLYGITTVGQVFAVDAASGRTVWVHDPESYLSAKGDRDFRFPKHRGVTWWNDGDDARILVTTIDAYLLALDAETGEPVAGFGEKGRVDLLEGLRRRKVSRLKDYFQTSPAAIHGDTLVVGGTVGDRPRGPRGIPGDVRGYDVRTGALRWTFHVVPTKGEVGVDTWEDGSWRHAGAANVWGPMSVDDERGIVYLTTSTPTNDYYGGHRPGDNLFAESLVALDAETGERLWHFQLVHHGLWDYDPGAAANLVDITVGGRRIEAVAQVTKQGFTFVFDRVSGEPVWPIEERPVPASDVPGERASPTQPIPTRPPPFARQGLSEDDLVDFTPFLREKALRIFRQYRSGPLFTPPSLRGSLYLPGANGGTNWRGAGFDPETGVLYVPSINQATLVRLSRGNGGSGFRYSVRDTKSPWVAGDGRSRYAVPLIKPPYSAITAIDLNEGTLLWQVPNGDGPRNHPGLAHLDLPPLGSGAHTCVLVTPDLVIAGDGSTFFGGEIGDPVLRAYDKKTGEVVGRIDVPGRVQNCPMTYRHEGVQYLVMAVVEAPDTLELIALTPR